VSNWESIECPSEKQGHGMGREGGRAGKNSPVRSHVRIFQVGPPQTKVIVNPPHRSFLVQQALVLSGAIRDLLQGPLARTIREEERIPAKCGTSNGTAEPGGLGCGSAEGMLTLPIGTGADQNDAAIVTTIMWSVWRRCPPPSARPNSFSGRRASRRKR
jgi:hypothetical protein